MKFTLTPLLVLALCTCVVADEKEAAEPEHEIVLSVGEGPFIFNTPIPLQVKYLNRGEQSWKLQTPQDSSSVLLRFRLIGENGRPHGYSLGRELTTTITRPNGKRMTAFLGDASKPMLIEPDQTHEFSTTFWRNANWIVPGHWVVWLEDHNTKLESNRIEIPLRFTLASVEPHFEYVKISENHIYIRKWHAKWLQRLDPQLILDWPDSKATEEVKAQRELEIQKHLKEFAEYWKSAKDTRRVARVIAEINREAGLKPEE